MDDSAKQELIMLVPPVRCTEHKTEMYRGQLIHRYHFEVDTTQAELMALAKDVGVEQCMASSPYLIAARFPMPYHVGGLYEIHLNEVEPLIDPRPPREVPRGLAALIEQLRSGSAEVIAVDLNDPDIQMALRDFGVEGAPYDQFGSAPDDVTPYDNSGIGGEAVEFQEMAEKGTQSGG